MQTTNKPEYIYYDAQAGHHHHYLFRPLMELLKQATESVPPDKARLPRVLDLGCGNGSLSHAIAEQSFEVVGVEESASGIVLAAQTYPTCRFVQGKLILI
jgi:2-polyprenyl-3-methyl-5-hydroxy-6-metoxy-1,4-benzoquinol methylase